VHLFASCFVCRVPDFVWTMPDLLPLPARSAAAMYMRHRASLPSPFCRQPRCCGLDSWTPLLFYSLLFFNTCSHRCSTAPFLLYRCHHLLRLYGFAVPCTFPNLFSLFEMAGGLCLLLTWFVSCLPVTYCAGFVLLVCCSFLLCVHGWAWPWGEKGRKRERGERRDGRSVFCGRLQSGSKRFVCALRLEGLRLLLT